MHKTCLKSIFAAVAGVSLLAACDSGGTRSSDGYQGAPVMAESVEFDRSAKMASEPAPPPPGQTDTDPPSGGVMLAYAYNMGISAPKETIEPMMGAHQQKCIAAGSSVCQVLGASVNRWGEDQVSAYLNLRATPEWLTVFREEIAKDADGAGGRLTSNTVSTEDLTRYITDIDARLEAKTALRDRIRNLLETRDGSLSDVLAAERELARVQGEIDSMTAQLAAARARVSMSTLNISYSSDPETSVGLFKPLREAFGDFGRTSVQSLASAVRFVASSWPFFIVGMVVLIILRGWWRGRAKA